MTQFGTVVWFSDSKGYGEILSNDGGRIFFTYHAIKSQEERKSIPAGACVQFSLAPQKRLFGTPAARCVEILSRACLPAPSTITPEGGKISSGTSA